MPSDAIGQRDSLVAAPSVDQRTDLGSYAAHLDSCLDRLDHLTNVVLASAIKERAECAPVARQSYTSRSGFERPWPESPEADTAIYPRQKPAWLAGFWL